MSDVSRRTLIKVTGAVGAAMLPTALPSAIAAQGHVVPPTPTVGHSVAVEATQAATQTTYLFLNDEEAAFIEAAVARLIPADPQWPGGVEAGVPNYIDKQLGGAWGAGERLYRTGPWQPGTPSQGYQLPFTPAELFRTALAAINKELSVAGTPFARMSADQRDSYLQRLEAGGNDLSSVPSDVFFSHLWDCTVEGFFSDPVYGGNRDMVAWRMIGFPGAFASYYDLVDQHGIKIDRAPMSLAEDAHGHIHTVARQWESALVAAGYEVIDIVTTADDAVKVALERRPHLVLMDIYLLGEGDGVDAAIEIFQRCGIRSIFASAPVDSAGKVRAEAAQPLACLPKPFSDNKLVATVASAIVAVDTNLEPPFMDR